MSNAFVGVVSNIDFSSNIPAALRHLGSLVKVRATSTFYQTAAVGHPEQLPFANGVWHIETDMGPHKLKFSVCRAVEKKLGRSRASDRFAPRTIDLDLLLYDDVVINEAGLILPEPEIRTRSFVAVPLIELVPGCVLPDTGELLSCLSVSRDPSLKKIESLTETLQGIINDRL
jgi:2-amino-4-hydroxy-6-hydroxymethyldihydropteridine diphosphokinase